MAPVGGGGGEAVEEEESGFGFRGGRVVDVGVFETRGNSEGFVCSWDRHFDVCGGWGVEMSVDAAER